MPGARHRGNGMIDLPPRVRLGFAIVVTAAGLAILVGVPAYFLWYAPTFVEGYSDPQNVNMFFGLFGALIGLTIGLSGGYDVYQEHRRRQRFDELVEGRRKSEFRKSLAELENLVRQLPAGYRERLEEAKEEHGLD